MNCCERDGMRLTGRWDGLCSGLAGRLKELRASAARFGRARSLSGPQPPGAHNAIKRLPE